MDEGKDKCIPELKNIFACVRPNFRLKSVQVKINPHILFYE